MDRVKCGHGIDCMLKTGTKPGPSYGHSFYLCQRPSKEQCKFLKEIKLPIMQCPHHGAPVGLRVWSRKKPNEILYYCAQRGSKAWCGSLDTEAEKENADPHPLERKSKADENGGKSNTTQHQPLHLSMSEESGSSEEDDDSTDPETDSSVVVAADKVVEHRMEGMVHRPEGAELRPEGVGRTLEGVGHSLEGAGHRPKGVGHSSSSTQSEELTDQEDDSIDSQSTSETGNTTYQTCVDSGSEMESDSDESSDVRECDQDDQDSANTLDPEPESADNVNETSVMSLGNPGGVQDFAYRTTSVIDSNESETEEEDISGSSPHESHPRTTPLDSSHNDEQDSGDSYVEVVGDSCSEEEKDASEGSPRTSHPSATPPDPPCSEGPSMDDLYVEVVDSSDGEEEETGVESSKSVGTDRNQSLSSVDADQSPKSVRTDCDQSSSSVEASQSPNSVRTDCDQSLSSVVASQSPNSAGTDRDVSLSSDSGVVSQDASSEGLRKFEQSSAIQHSHSTNLSSTLSSTHADKIEVLSTTDSDDDDSDSVTGASSSGMDATRKVGSDETDYHVDSVHPGENRILELTNPVKPSFPATSTHGAKTQDRAEPQFKVGYQYRTLVKQLEQMEMLIRTMSDKLPDGGAQLRAQKQAILGRMAAMKRPLPVIDVTSTTASGPTYHNKMGHLTHQAKMLTTGAVEHIHSSLENCPTDSTLADNPDGLRVDLMTHQRRALAWMEWREGQTPSGGILADDMGLGKTLSILSLVLKKKGCSQEVKEWMAKPPAAEGLVKCPGTLVVCPASVMMQWEAEVNSKVRRGLLRVKVYHGSNRTKFASDLAAYDVVVTTFQTVGMEGQACDDEDEEFDKPRPRRRVGSKTTLFEIHWNRVILDEAHVIRNPKTALSIGACRLKCDHRWAVTGTPIQNKLNDFYSLIRFIRLAPFDNFRVWKDTVERKQSLGMQRLNTIVSGLVLRRTKEELGPELLKLTKRVVETHSIQLKPAEQQVYDALFFVARRMFVIWLKEHDEFHSSSDPASTEQAPTLPPDFARVLHPILAPYQSGSGGKKGLLSLLLRLRQSCCHLQLLTSAMVNSDMDTGLEDAMGSLSLSDARSWAAPELPQAFNREERSTKLQDVLTLVHKVYSSNDQPPQKCLIVSQWTSFLDIMQYHLARAGISYTQIDGRVPPKQRAAVLSRFNSPHKDPSVMLLALQAGGVGLNLTSANHVFMLDIHWNPALEVQAADRCHRVGQTRDVFIHRFVCQGTVEERIIKLQEKKLQLAQSVLSGASEGARDSNKLTLNDLKHLFAVD